MGKTKIIHKFLNKFGRYIWKHGSSKLIYSLCRPQSTIVDPRKFVLCPDEAMIKKLLCNILSHDKKHITTLVGVGEYLYTLSREENHNFVISFLTTISRIWDKRCSYETRLVIDGFTNEGEREELIPVYRIIFARFITLNCSINVIFKFCRASVPGDVCSDQLLLVDRLTLVNQLTIKFHECLFGLQLDYHCCISRGRQVEDIGRNYSFFLFTVKDQTFLNEVVGAFVTVIQQKFSVKIPWGLEMNYHYLNCQDPTLASPFFDGLTSFGEHLQPLREKFPKLIENLERYTSVYRSFKKIHSSNYLFDV
ncbi:unnamed protein product [Mytilus coruscus]|uniref:Uncharacterized protein n=1 Tax=Mytilus coruscus TaxID=42192 RepID=A0A6J8ELB7_MYTCO|nr:unnamed protein product [Mytilus coruscus]